MKKQCNEQSNQQQARMTSLISAALIASSYAIAPVATAAQNPFIASPMVDLVQVAGMEGACGEGRCGSGEANNRPSAEIQEAKIQDSSQVHHDKQDTPEKPRVRMRPDTAAPVTTPSGQSIAPPTQTREAGGRQ